MSGTNRAGMSRKTKSGGGIMIMKRDGRALWCRQINWTFA